MELDPLLLSRIQFAFCVSFHIIFPSFTIGLAAWLAILDGMAWRTGKAVYRRLFRFWLQIFGVSFALGAVSGIVLAFQFGTNWSVLADKGGAIQGPLLGYEAFTAFVLEATFLGVVLVGRNKVPPWAYFFSCCMVALGTTCSAFWIMVNNTWMQIPVAYSEVGGRFVPVDWMEILFGGVVPIRIAHMLLAAYLTTAFCVAATGAWYMLRTSYLHEARIMLKSGIVIAFVLVPVQMYFGHLSGEYTAVHQPSKFTAIEGRWETQQPANLVLFAIPDEENERNYLEISVPKLGSLVDTGSTTSSEPGIKTIPRELRPPLWAPFFGFRIMVGMGLIMLALAWAGAFVWWRKKLETSDWFLWPMAWSFPVGFVAVISGWFVAEIGRQPWVIFGKLKTVDALTPSLTGGQVLTTLIAYIVVYSLIFTGGTIFIFRLIRNGPAQISETRDPVAVTSKRPIAVSGDAPGARLDATDGRGGGS
ncbi:MAG: cytochrome ubiquinol oxidase subunit I [Hyphomicrobiales bacterium]